MTLREAIEKSLREKRWVCEDNELVSLTVRVLAELVGVDQPQTMVERKWGASYGVSAYEAVAARIDVAPMQRARAIESIEKALRGVLTEGLHPLRRPVMEPGDGPEVRETVEEWDRDVLPWAYKHKRGNEYLFKCRRLAIRDPKKNEILWSEPADWVKAEGKS